MRGIDKGFTLIELLIVVAILGVLAATVLIVLNPVELLAQSRDGQRFSDLDNLSRAIALYQEQSSSSTTPGNANTVYVSVADSSSTCGDIGLPALPSGWSYACSATPRSINGSGWIPVNFNADNGDGISALPIDPVDTTSTNLYYTYVTSGNQYELTAVLESQKYRAKEEINPPISIYPGVLAEGDNLTISPLFNPSGLVGYWNFDDGTGTTANDSSVTGDSGSLDGAVIASWVSGKILGALSFNGSTSFVNIPDNANLDMSSSSTFTFSAWIYDNNLATEQMIFSNTNTVIGWHVEIYTSKLLMQVYPSGAYTEASVALQNDTWYHLVVTYNAGDITYYINGQAAGTASYVFSTPTGLSKKIGIFFNGSLDFNGIIDDVRIYNRVLSAAEVQALYNSEK